MSLWTVGDIARATQGTLHGDAASNPATSVTGVSIDTRSLVPGDLFIALRGPNNDAHDFAGTAVEAGAAALLVERPLDLSTPQIIVKDTTAALDAMGRDRRAAAKDAFVLGITGSVGKTGTKELAAAGFSALGPTHATRGNLNNHFGVPLTLARMPVDTRFAVIEMGMSAPGEIRALSRMVRPHAALITWVSAAHSAFFNGTEEIADAKAEIFEGLNTEDGSTAEREGLAVLPADNPYFDRLLQAAQHHAGTVRTFGADQTADLRLSTDAGDGARRINGTPVHLQLAGDQWYSALAGLLAVLPAAGLRDPDADTAAFITAAGAVEPLRGRGQTLSLPGIDGGAAQLIDESYNASPAAMEAALRLLVQTPTAGRRIAVLGDMLELDDPATEHARIGRLIAAMPIDVVHVCGAYADTVLAEVEPGQRGLSAPKALDLYTGIAQSIHGGDTWLVKGSLGSEVHLLVDKLTP